ncbi:hypothetical protein WA538_001323 [Blastocystis sp. DL]
MGEKERNGKKLFVPGDVPPSDLLQKRTASYAVQSLVMGARKDGKAYNSARYSVSFPHAEQNKKRGIPVSEIRKRHTMDVETTNAPSARPKEMTQYYVYDLQESTISLFDMIMEDMSPLSEPVSTETTIKYFGQMSQSTYDITLTLQTTMVRFTYLSMFLRRWGGPISAVIRVTPSEYPTVQRMLKKSHFPARLVVSVVIDAGDDYPINFLRNAAIRAAATSHFFVCDMDVWPLESVYATMVETMASETVEGSILRRGKTAVIIPVYEYVVACSSFKSCVRQRDMRIPATKRALRTCLGLKKCREFRQGQDLHNYYFPEWLSDNFTQILTPVNCFVKDKQEPYLIVPKTAELPYFDEAFKNYGYNKVEWVADLRYAGYRFYVFGPGFGVDVAHPRGKYQKAFLGTMIEKHVIPNKSLYEAKLAKLARSRKSVTRTCGKDRVEVCLDCPLV